MRLPNNYGCIFKLSGSRRKPYAVRIKIGEHPNGSGIFFRTVFDEWITEHERYKSVSQKTHESYIPASGPQSSWS